jgi:hypothetical protein
VELVAEYLAHPERDRTQRLAAAARECGPLDGRSGRRVAEHLLSFLDGMAPVPASGGRQAREAGVAIAEESR